MAGLSLSLILFFLFVLLPGNFALLVAGKTGKGERSLGRIIGVGALVFSFVLIVTFFLRSFGLSNILDDFIFAVVTFSSGEASINLKNLNFGSVALMFGLTYIAAFVFGMLDILLLTSWTKPQKNWLEYQLKKVRKKGGAQFRLSPGKLLLDVMVAYRIAGRRPYLRLWFKDGRKVEGECLKYSWGGTESLLVRDADIPEKIIWISLDAVEQLELLDFRISEEDKEMEKKRLVLDFIEPGLSDEFFDKRS
ncbi:MAG: hypothetical protein H0Z39_07065 [Peptococcaceae bacterium]|nr:hypothetical protein [Peptococcaceae bacterium]